MQVKYLLDSNIFIESHNIHYHPNFCEGFWDWITKGFEANIFFSIDKVKVELLRHNDDLSQRIKDHSIPSDFFIKSLGDPLITQSYGHLMDWLNSTTNFTPKAVSDFQSVSGADSFLIAAAMSYDYIIVTKETSDPNCKKRVKIPDAAKANSVQCITLHQLLNKHAEDNFKLKI